MPDPFWVYLCCFIVAVGGILAVEAFDKGGKSGLATTVLALMIAASLVLIAKGAVMAIGWTNPFEGKGQEVAQSVHSPRSGLFVLALSVWPYFLMGVGTYFGFVSASILRRRLRKARA